MGAEEKRPVTLREKPPCFRDNTDCPRRCEGCHARCEDYLAWAAGRRQAREASWSAENGQRDAEARLVESRIRQRKRRDG